MAGRIRTIKPEMLEDERVAGLSLAAFKLFIGCILSADDHGTLRGASGVLLGRVFWKEAERETMTASDVTRALAELVSVGIVEVAEVRGQRYAAIKNWEKHQKVDRPGRRLTPDFSEGRIINDSALLGEIREDCGKLPVTLATDLRPPTSDLDLRPTTNDRREVPPAADQLPLSPPEPFAGSGEPASPSGGGSGPKTAAVRIWGRYVVGWHRIHGTRGRPPKLDDKRRRLVNARLRDFDEEALGLAADGIWRSDWHVQAGQTSFDLVMRDSAHVERFMVLGEPVQAAVQRETLPEAPASPSARLLAFAAATPAPEPPDVATGQPEALAAALAGIGRRAS